MVKHTQTICQQKLMNCLSVFDHYVGLALKKLTLNTFSTTVRIITHFSRVLHFIQKPVISFDWFLYEMRHWAEIFTEKRQIQPTG